MILEIRDGALKAQVYIYLCVWTSSFLKIKYSDVTVNNCKEAVLLTWIPEKTLTQRPWSTNPQFHIPAIMDDSGLEPYKHGYYLWKYVPSLPAAIVFAILFFGTTMLHSLRVWKSRLWYCTWFVLGGLSTSTGGSLIASVVLYLSLTAS